MLLPREEVAADIKRAFTPQIALLEEMVNYGTNLVPNTFESSGKKLHDLVIIHNFLKQAVALLDGIHLLVQAGAVIDANILLRGVFEIRIYLEWMFERDVVERGTLYYVWNIRNKRKWTLRAMPGTPENARFLSEMGHKAFDTKIPPLDFALLATDLAHHNDLLARPEFAAINLGFEKHGDTNWYQAAGIRNVRALAARAGVEAEYTVYYPWFSKLTHGLALDDHFDLTPSTTSDRLVLDSKAIRGVAGLESLFRQTYNFAQKIFELVIKHYRPEALADLHRKYVNEWRERAWSIPKLDVLPDGKIRITPTKPPPWPKTP